LEAPSRFRGRYAENDLVIAIVPARLKTPDADWSRSGSSPGRSTGLARALIRIIEGLGFKECKSGFPTDHSCLAREWAVHRVAICVERGGEASRRGNAMVIGVNMDVDVVSRKRVDDVIEG
jgi:hypothetical protein